MPGASLRFKGSLSVNRTGKARATWSADMSALGTGRHAPGRKVATCHRTSKLPVQGRRKVRPGLLPSDCRRKPCSCDRWFAASGTRSLCSNDFPERRRAVSLSRALHSDLLKERLQRTRAAKELFNRNVHITGVTGLVNLLPQPHADLLVEITVRSLFKNGSHVR